MSEDRQVTLRSVTRAPVASVTLAPSCTVSAVTGVRLGSATEDHRPPTEHGGGRSAATVQYLHQGQGVTTKACIPVPPPVSTTVAMRFPDSVGIVKLTAGVPVVAAPIGNTRTRVLPVG